MPGITLEQAEAALANWIAADAAVSKNQSYTMDDRTLTRAHASEVRENLNFWENKIAVLSRQAAGQRGLSISVARFK